MQVDSIKPKLKPPGTKRLKLKCDTMVSTAAFKFNLRRYTLAVSLQAEYEAEVRGPGDRGGAIMRGY